LKGKSLTDELSLLLALVEEGVDKLSFCLTLRNGVTSRILVPYPEINNLHFGNKATLRESEWCTHMFVSASSWSGFVLESGEEKTIEYCFRRCEVGSPTWADGYSDDFRRSVDLPPGEYLVWFQMEVGEKYFCPDSHYRFADLLREARASEAVVWTGRGLSNRLTLNRTD
jgi:hypothetical protein